MSKIRHITVKSHHALYKDGEFLTGWYGDQKPVQDIFDLLTRLNLDLSERGIVREYAGKTIFEEYLEPFQEWPETYEELDKARDMALYKRQKKEYS